MDNLNPENLTPAEEIKKAEEIQGTKDQEFNPYKNDKAISIIQQADGNFRGWAQKNGKMIDVREIKPEDCLGQLLTSA